MRMVGTVCVLRKHREYDTSGTVSQQSCDIVALIMNY